MGNNQIRTKFQTSALCVLTVVLFIVLGPVLAVWGGSYITNTEEVSARTEVKQSPDRPLSPEQAHRSLQERELGWPDGTGQESSRSAATVQNGVRVSIPYDTVSGETSHANSAVRVEVIRGASVIQTVNTTTNEDRLFGADLSTGNITSGDIVRVTDMADASSVSVNCNLTGSFNTDTNSISGTSPGDTTIDIYICGPSNYYGDIPPGLAHKTAAGANWTADFSGTLDIWRGDVAYIYSTDPGNNIVMEVARTGESLVVYPQYEDVLGYYNPNASLTVNAGSSTQTVGTSKDGFFAAWFVDHDITTGEVVTCKMGASTRSVTVTDTTAGQTSGTNSIYGKCSANKNVRLIMNPYNNPVVYTAFTDAQGEFSVNLGSYSPSGNEVYNVAWYDSDGDCVVYEFLTAFGAVTTTWYLAEGYTGVTPYGGSFDTYVLLQNPTTADAETTLTFQVQDGTAQPLNTTIPANSRVTVHLDELPGLTDASVSTKVTSTNGVSINAERAMYFNYYGRKGGHDSIGVSNTGTAWYFAEGYTGEEFDTWVLVQNPGTTDATVKMAFQLQNGTAPDKGFKVPAGTRLSIKLDDQPGLADASVSTLVTSNVPIVAERAMYFNYKGNDDGSDSLGVRAPAGTWYMAEGYTGGDFDTWVLVQNPGTTEANITMKFQLQDGTAPDKVFKLPAGTRQSVKLDDLPGLANASVSTKVTSDVDVVAERAEYFNYYGKTGGHTSHAATSLARGWYLPEGYTGVTREGSFDTYVLVQNPSDEDALVRLSFQLPSGNKAGDQVYTVAANKRLTVHLNELPGLTQTDVSTTVSSNEPVIVERAMYFNYYGINGGHDSLGIPF